MPNMMLVMQNEEEYDISGFVLRQRRCWQTIFRFVRWKKLFKVQKNKLKQALFRMSCR